MGGGLGGDPTSIAPKVLQTQIYNAADLGPNREISSPYINCGGREQISWLDEVSSTDRGHFMFPWTNEALTSLYDRLRRYLAGKKVVAVCNSDFVLTAVMAGAKPPVEVIDNNLPSLFLAELKAVAAARLDRRQDFKKFFEFLLLPNWQRDQDGKLDGESFLREVFQDLASHLSDHARNYFDQIITEIDARWCLSRQYSARGCFASNAPYLDSKEAYSGVRLASSSVVFYPKSIEQFFDDTVPGQASRAQCDTAYLSNAPTWINGYGWGSCPELTRIADAVGDHGHILVSAGKTSKSLPNTRRMRRDQEKEFAIRTGTNLTRVKAQSAASHAAIFNSMIVYSKLSLADLTA